MSRLPAIACQFRVAFAPFHLALGCTLCVGLALGGCKPDLIPGTSVEDTADNRAVLEFLGGYRSAVVERSVDGVTKLCAEDYFEDNGTVDQSDDYGLSGLRDHLKADFGRTNQVELDLIVQSIARPDDKSVRVTYRFNERARVSFPAGEKWISISDVNEIVLRDAGDSFTIVSGL